MKPPRADGFRFVKVEQTAFGYLLPWQCIFERYRTRMDVRGTTALGAMKSAVRLSNEALAHELGEALRGNGEINWP